jgi:hypothetical protein
MMRINLMPSSGRRALPVGIGLLIALLFVVPAEAQLLPSFGRDRAGTSGFQFLKIPIDARAAALSETTVATAFDVSALYWNPALAAHAGRPQFGLSHTAYFADVSMNYLAAVYPWRNITFGASLQALTSPQMDVTTEFQPTGTGETFGFTAMAVGLTASQALSDLFSYGITAKLIHESTAGLNTQTYAIDLGIFYRVGDTGAQMAVAIRNFGVDGTPQGEIERVVIGEGVVVERDFSSITPPTTFLLGFAYQVLDAGANRVQLSGQISNPNDNAETIGLGAEYIWNDLLVLRTGYRFGVDETTAPSVGLGLNIPMARPMRFDYSFNSLDRLGAVHRLSLNASL